MYKLLFSCFLFSLVVACSGREDTVSLAVESEGCNETEMTFWPTPSKKVFGDIKRIPDKASERLNHDYAQFKLRSSVAAKLLADGFDGDESLKVDLQEKISASVINMYLDVFSNKLVSGADLKSFFESNKILFSEKTFSVSHILLKVSNGMSDEQVREKSELAYDIHEKIETGLKFADLVELYSEDASSKEVKGFLGSFVEARLDVTIRDALKGLAVGEVSGVVLTDRGFQIFRVDSVHAETPNYEAVENTVKYEYLKAIKSEELSRLYRMGTI